METRILVTYATSSGSTQEVAEVVAATMQECGSSAGLVVDLQPARDVRTLAGYSAVVLGAALYMFHMHKDALRFLSRHQRALSGGLPIAIFAGGPYGDANEEVYRSVRESVDRDLARFAWLKPAAVEIVGGRFDPARLRLPWSLLPYMKLTPPSDLRDWDAIRAWARRMAAQFLPVTPNGMVGEK